MTNTKSRSRSDRALALQAEAGRIRDESMRTPDVLKAISLSVKARRLETAARDLSEPRRLLN